jgi:hypothetical protein
MCRACSMHRREERCIQTSGRKTQGKIPLEKPKHKCEGNIKMGLRETE